MMKTSIVVGFALLVLALSVAAHAEWYVGGYGGGNFPNKLSNVEGTGTSAVGNLGVNIAVKSSDLELENSITYGAKVGYYLPHWNFLGFEVDASTATPDFKAQGFTRTATINGVPAGPTSTAQLPAADLRVTTVAFHILFRYPGRFQPYIGGGPAYYRANFSSSDPRIGKASDSAVGVSAVAGARYFFTKQLAGFAEYKYNAANFDFGGNAQFKGDYSANIVVGGLSVFFR